MTELKADVTPPRTDEHCVSDEAWAEFCRQYAGKPRSLGQISDFQLANEIYMVGRNDLALLKWQTAAKERIRWLSIELAKANHRIAHARPAATSNVVPRWRDEVSDVCDYVPSHNARPADDVVDAAKVYMSQSGQALEAHGIRYGAAQIEADERLRAALAKVSQ